MPLSIKLLKSLIIFNLVIGLILIYVLSIKLIVLIETHFISGLGLITFAELIAALITLGLLAGLYKSSFFKNINLKLELNDGQAQQLLVALGLFVGFYVLTFLMAQFVYAWFVDVDQINSEYQNHFSGEQNSFISPFGNIQLVIGILLIAPVLEEIIFRGVLYSGLKKYWNFWVAALVSGLIFALFHVSLSWSWQLNAVVIIEIFIFGFGLAWLMEYSRNLIYPIIVHGLNNFVAGLSLIFI